MIFTSDPYDWNFNCIRFSNGPCLIIFNRSEQSGFAGLTLRHLA